jgi:hypothetical protein
MNQGRSKDYDKAVDWLRCGTLIWPPDVRRSG